MHVHVQLLQRSPVAARVEDITISPMAVPSYDYQCNWLSGPKVRLDLGITLRVPKESLQVAPHGIVGQSFDGDGIGIIGARDPVPRAGTNLTTTAIAEGAIEGSWRDYVMASEYDTAFKFSRFGAAFAAPRDTAALTGELTGASARWRTRAPLWPPRTIRPGLAGWSLWGGRPRGGGGEGM